MFSRTLISLAIVATSAFAMALDKRAVSCETSGGSPTVFDAETAARVIVTRGNADCCQSNGSGSLCTTLTSAGTASVGICGPKKCFPCRDIGNQLLDVVNQCKSNDLVGGQNSIQFSGNRVILFHS